MRRLPLYAVSAVAAALAVVPAVTGPGAPSLRGAVPVSVTAAQVADDHGSALEPGDDRVAAVEPTVSPSAEPGDDHGRHSGGSDDAGGRRHG